MIFGLDITLLPAGLSCLALLLFFPVALNKMICHYGTLYKALKAHDFTLLYVHFFQQKKVCFKPYSLHFEHTVLISSIKRIKLIIYVF